VGDGSGVTDGVTVMVGGGGWLGVPVGLRVRVGNGVRVGIGVFVEVGVGGKTLVGVSNTSGGYSSSMAEYQSSPPVRVNSVKRAPRK